MNQLALDLQPTTQEYRTIPLTQGQVAIVDSADYKSLSRYKWHAWLDRHTLTFYARRNEVYKKGKPRKTIMMHREIVSAGFDVVVDHHDHDTLNNRRGNLRPCSVLQNNRNVRLRSDNKSGFKGVYAYGKKWRAQIRINRKAFLIGTFESAELASQAYIQMAIDKFGEFAFNHSSACA